MLAPISRKGLFRVLLFRLFGSVKVIRFTGWLTEPINREIAYLIRVGGHYALRIEAFTM
ncbi:hypothetical protein M107_5236 [Bacteroides fragilis str. 3725 D9(v)]|uniref:hypothetical protein n=1 Tax=Bacteroides TaxID=816 RepID=UPI00044B328F|nr:MULTISPECIES: hypothetical protein [Bacteroides]EXZ60613.1 hypothetical protein M107_5193 [Bacteroides fragilis str. 3725 D9(v)]EXZ60656.1 hypothetical protein M107_5236 [Bacteroides fragilis str. 3725 D9(v)]